MINAGQREGGDYLGNVIFSTTLGGKGMGGGCWVFSIDLYMVFWTG